MEPIKYKFNQFVTNYLFSLFIGPFVSNCLLELNSCANISTNQRHLFCKEEERIDPVRS
jgi:hypothetical protein